VARSHLCNTIARVSEALVEPYEELAKYIPTEPVLTGISRMGSDRRPPSAFLTILSPIGGSASILFDRLRG
jgi:hypothetical protein